MIIKLTTTGVIEKFTIPDLGDLEVSHPVDIILTNIFSKEELFNSNGLKEAINKNFIILKDENNNNINNVFLSNTNVQYLTKVDLERNLVTSNEIISASSDDVRMWSPLRIKEAINNLTIIDLSKAINTLNVNNGGTGLNSCNKGEMLYAIDTNVFGLLKLGEENQTLRVGDNNSLKWVTTTLNTNFTIAQNINQLSFTNTSFANRISLTLNNLETGIYRIGFYTEATVNSTSAAVNIRILVNGSSYAQLIQTPRITSNFLPFNGFFYEKLSGNVTIIMQYLVTASTGIIRNSYLEFWRVE